MRRQMREDEDDDDLGELKPTEPWPLIIQFSDIEIDFVKIPGTLILHARRGQPN